MTDRWQPSRAGIINVWRYYDEIFSFYQGRLLLRGPNGTGKSKALELLLPYLFDANLRPHRLSTFGSADRTMHWNLMGEGNQGSTRVGYVWLEFQHGEQWFTCGARLQATTNTSNVNATYFTTSLRVGDLALVNEAGRPLTKTDLVAAIGEHGVVHASPADYRHTVRTTLFPGVTEQTVRLADHRAAAAAHAEAVRTARPERAVLVAVQGTSAAGPVRSDRDRRGLRTARPPARGAAAARRGDRHRRTARGRAARLRPARSWSGRKDWSRRPSSSRT